MGEEGKTTGPARGRGALKKGGWERKSERWRTSNMSFVFHATSAPPEGSQFLTEYTKEETQPAQEEFFLFFMLIMLERSG